MPQKFANAQELVEIEEIRQSTLLMKNGSLRQILMVGGINFALKSDAEQNVIIQSYQNFLNSLNFPIEIVIHSRKVNIERYLERLEERRTQESSLLLQNQIGEYKEFIRGFVTQNTIMSKMFLVVVPFFPVSLPSKETVRRFLPFLKKKTDEVQDEALRAKEREAAFAENLSQLAQRTNQAVDGLVAIGLEAEVLNDQQLLELFYNLYNPETVEKKGVPLPK